MSSRVEKHEICKIHEHCIVFEHNSAPRHRNRSILGQVEATGLPELSKHHIALTNSQEEEKHQFQNFRKIEKS